MWQWKQFSFAFGAKTTTSAVLALVASSALLLLLVLVRMRQSEENRRRALAQLVFAVLATSLSLVRVVMLPLGWGDRFVHRTLGVMDTVCLGLAITLTLIRLFFEVIPGRFEKRVPPIIAEVVVMVAFIIIILSALGDSVAKNVSSLVATSAVLTAVLGLALQSTLSNLFAGLALQMDRAFSSGDWIQVGEREGRIIEVRWRSTALRTKDGDMVLLPNSKLLSEDVHNFSRPLERRRVWLKVSFHYRHPPNEVKTIIKACVRGIPGVMTDPAPDCFPREFGESSITYAVRLWIEKYERTAEIEGEALTRIWYAAKRANLEIPFPTRTLLMQTDDGSKREADTKAERARRIDLLARMDLFESLQPTDQELLADGMRHATFAAGQAIIEQGEAGTSMYIVTKGQVRVSIARGNASRDLATLGEGDFFGEMSMLTGEPRAATCWAVGDVDCYVVDHHAMGRVLSASPNIADELAVVLLDRQTEVNKEAAALSKDRRLEARVGLVTRIRNFFDLNG